MAKSTSAGKKPEQRGKTKVIATESIEINPIDAVNRIRELAWAGQHSRAIEFANQAITAKKVKPAVRMDLLDLRAESYIAQGRLDLAAKDLEAMVQLATAGITATGGKKSALLAQALNMQALVEMRQGNLPSALKNATDGLKAAQQSNQQPIIAKSLYTLSEAQWRNGQNEAGVETANEAIALYESLGDLIGCRPRLLVALCCLPRGGIAPAAQKALDLCQRAGDQFGIGNANNSLSISQRDIVERINFIPEAIQAFRLAGYTERETIALGNLAVTYLDLGLYSHGRRLLLEGNEKNRSMGANLILLYGLGNLIDTEIRQGLL